MKQPELQTLIKVLHERETDKADLDESTVIELIRLVTDRPAE